MQKVKNLNCQVGLYNINDLPRLLEGTEYEIVLLAADTSLLFEVKKANDDVSNTISRVCIRLVCSCTPSHHLCNFRHKPI